MFKRRTVSRLQRFYVTLILLDKIGLLKMLLNGGKQYDCAVNSAKKNQETLLEKLYLPIKFYY